jgi:hypothetical protein
MVSDNGIGAASAFFVPQCSFDSSTFVLISPLQPVRLIHAERIPLSIGERAVMDLCINPGESCFLSRSDTVKPVGEPVVRVVVEDRDGSESFPSW